MSELRREPKIIFDGACGTSIQAMDLPAELWKSYEGCNEFLNISAPEKITAMHRAFFEAGSMVVETNTFGANAVVLKEYGLEGRVEEINHKAVENARAACEGMPGRYIAGSLGPGTKLPTLGQIGFDELSGSYALQLGALLEAGADCLILETCQDLLQLKALLVTIYDVFEKTGKEVPVFVSVTIETTGTMLAGSDVGAVVATVRPFPVFSLGLNCATGPADMQSHLRYLSQYWDRHISCIPNAGLPEIQDGKTLYKLGPDEYAAALKGYVASLGVRVVGGCCGTTPTHIKALVKALEGVTPAERQVEEKPQVASLYQAVELQPEIPPLLIGERANTNGSKKFRELLLSDDFEGCLNIGLAQERAGAPVLDLCTAYAGRDETADLTRLVEMFARSVKSGMVLDSTTPHSIEAGLKRYPGRLIVNSINLEDGGKYLERVVTLVKRFGCAVIALAIHEKGQAMTAGNKVETARRIYELAVDKYGLRPSDILFDPLTFPVGTGSDDLKDAGIQTINAIKRIKKEMPGALTTIGLSNISFGLSPGSRKVLNSVFLHECVSAGLDTAIVDAAKILPVASIPEDDRKVCLDLIYNRDPEGKGNALDEFIGHFDSHAAESRKQGDETGKAAEQRLAGQLIKGNKEGLDDLLTILLNRYSPVSIINTMLIPAMKVVGDLFGKGEMLLPFVLQSAEVMKKSVSFLEPYMESREGDNSAPRVLLATVQGDVHDIGKNLVDIILSNNGYNVFNIGIKAPAETILQKAREFNVDVIGLSGLLVKSAIVMKESLPQYRQAGLTAPILLGGAALTKKFVAEECVPGYDSPVVYCADAFAGLKACESHKEGKLEATKWVSAGGPARKAPSVKNEEVKRDNPVPEPPFTGLRHVTDIPVASLFDLVNEQALFRGRWGYRRKKMTAEAYAELIDTRVKPLYEKLKTESLEAELITPVAAYGYFNCYSEDNNVIVDSPEGPLTFNFPRQSLPPHFCISDFFHTKAQGGDIAGFFVVSIGAEIDKTIKKLFDGDDYHNYLMLHGFSVEVTDALAEYWHREMRRELGITGSEPGAVDGFIIQEYQGSRYGFGYPACPDLEAHVQVFKLLQPEKLGITLTENMQMVPEQTTSAIVAHHPQAKYFAV